MSKKILFIFFVIFGLIVLEPLISSGDRVIDVQGLEIVQTVSKISAINRHESIAEISSSYTKAVSYSLPRRATTSSSSTNPGADTGYGSALGNYISISGKNIPVIDVTSTTVNAQDHVNKYGDRFYYGHNSASVFGGLVNYGVGSTFSINYGGVQHNYRVAKTVIYEKNAELGTLQLNGSGSYMKAVAKARSDNIQYDISLMTCYGTSYANGGASHRLVIFANEI